MDEYISVGKILNFHGIKGEAKVGFTKGQENFFLALRDVFVKSNPVYPLPKGSRLLVSDGAKIIECTTPVKTKADGKKYAVFKVITQVDISFPIIERIMGFRFFQASGDTKEIQLQGPAPLG